MPAKKRNRRLSSPSALRNQPGINCEIVQYYEVPEEELFVPNIQQRVHPDSQNARQEYQLGYGDGYNANMLQEWQQWGHEMEEWGKRQQLRAALAAEKNKNRQREQREEKEKEEIKPKPDMDMSMFQIKAFILVVVVFFGWLAFLVR